MLICHCRAVSDHTVRRHLLDGVRHERDLIVRCGAGGRCGGCLPHLRRLLAEFDGPPSETEPAANAAA